MKKVEVNLMTPGEEMPITGCIILFSTDEGICYGHYADSDRWKDMSYTEGNGDGIVFCTQDVNWWAYPPGQIAHKEQATV